MDDEQAFEEEPSIELARLAQETLTAQSGTAHIEDTRLRCQRVIDLYARGVIQDARDNFHAALVLLYGETPAHYELARMLARRSVAMGDARAWTVQAMAWDRWLLAKNQPQRFGTQIIKKGGIWSLGEVDPQVSDSERALYGVPPLFVQQQLAKQLRQRDSEES